MEEKRYALVSVSDKAGVETLGRGLVDLGFSILSTGGTARALKSAGLPITRVSDYTGFPEILDGRVKTLHPRIYGGILARESKDHIKDLRGISASLIELVIVNLYPFEEAAAVQSTPLDGLVEKIDIGGPCLLRAAAKNFERVTVVCDPKKYEDILWHLAHDGEVPKSARFELAVAAFEHTATYDRFISDTLARYDAETGQREGG
jgi:phosphoribosylaminoimidazolecarboxamide formyltransferase/IMP cyclohydrolase